MQILEMGPQQRTMGILAADGIFIATATIFFYCGHQFGLQRNGPTVPFPGITRQHCVNYCPCNNLSTWTLAYMPGHTGPHSRNHLKSLMTPSRETWWLMPVHVCCIPIAAAVELSWDSFCLSCDHIHVTSRCHQEHAFLS